MHPDDLADAQQTFMEVMQTPGKSFTREYRIQHKNGSYIWIEGNLTNLLDDESIKGFVLNYRDITQRKENDLRIKELNDSLDQKVKERTAELAGVNKELESFSYSISHDLRAPLRAVNGYAQILKEDYAEKLDDEALRVTNNIMSNAKRMGQLIDDLLEFSRNNRREMIVSDIDVYATIQNIIKEQLESEQGREIEFLISPLKKAKGDINMLRLVWINLIGNAIKYTRRTPKAKIEIFDSMDNGRVVYTIRDNGVGFDMKYVGKLFGVFQRLHTTEDFEGTGVGLALVSRIISRHGGKVTAQGAVNQGATFSFYID
jgi:light-regulated signal transduction histidine kinase (bacteriophytochrome)